MTTPKKATVKKLFDETTFAPFWRRYGSEIDFEAPLHSGRAFVMQERRATSFLPANYYLVAYRGGLRGYLDIMEPRQPLHMRRSWSQLRAKELSTLLAAFMGALLAHTFDDAPAPNEQAAALRGWWGVPNDGHDVIGHSIDTTVYIHHVERAGRLLYVVRVSAPAWLPDGAWTESRKE